MPSKPTPGRPSSVYRIYDATGELIYVGLTDRGHTRLSEHVSTKPWAWQIAETQWEHFGTRAEAAQRERDLIETQHPRHNVVYRSEEGEPDRIEFRFRADQLDLLRRCHREMEMCRGELLRRHREFEQRYGAAEKCMRQLLIALRAGRALTEAEHNTIDKYLRHTEMLERQKKAS